MHLITRGDVDGLACAVLLSIVENIESIRFAHPKDMQDGLYPVSKEDVIANLPYHPDCALWFDHHVSSIEDARQYREKRGAWTLAPSAARVIHDHYGEEHFRDFRDFLYAVDRFDSAQLDREDVLNPKGWIKIAYTIDPRSGLGRFREYFVNMVDWVKRMSLAEILSLPEVQERCQEVNDRQSKLLALIEEKSRLDGKIIVTDFRELEERPVGNRFLVYTRFPEATVEVRIFYGKGKASVVAAVGKSIFNRSCSQNVGAMLSEYGGGGHDGAGTCQLDPSEADEKIEEIINRLNQAS